LTIQCFTVYNHNTDAEYLRQALEEIEGLTVEGEESDYGLYVKTVNGITADYETDGAYWAFYTNESILKTALTVSCTRQ
jgi:hypothetical protein